MKHYKDPVTNQIYAYADNGSDDAFIKSGLVLITDAEVAIINSPTAAQIIVARWKAYQSKAQLALTSSDTTILRCAENAVAVPSAWSLYRKALRAIIRSATGDPTAPLPAKPTYPVGT